MLPTSHSLTHSLALSLSLYVIQVEIEGLTGDIKFNDDGRRVNYTLHVVEMTVNSAMVSKRIREHSSHSV